MSEAVEVECRNPECPGRTEAHAKSCVCDGTGEVLVAGTVTVIDQEEDEQGIRIVGEAPTKPCPEEPLDVDPERWVATWHPPTFERAGEWSEDIHCASCTEEGVPVDG